MLDKLVHDVKVMDSPGLTADLQPVVTKVITYSIANHGPFTLRTPAAQYSQAYVEAEIQKQVDILRALGVIPAS